MKNELVAGIPHLALDFARLKDRINIIHVAPSRTSDDGTISTTNIQILE